VRATGTPGRADHRTALWTGVAVLLWLALQVGVAARVQQQDPSRAIAPDTPSYERTALALLADGRFWTAPGSGEPQVHRTPGYPALLAATYAVVGRSPIAVVAIQLVMSGVILILASRLASGTGAAARWTALAILGLDVTFFASAQYLLTETFFTLQLVLFVLLWTAMRDPAAPGSRHLALAAAAGFVLAAMALTRPIAYYLPPLVALVTVLLARRDGWTGRRIWTGVAALLLPAVLILGIWQARNLWVSGSGTFSQITNVSLLIYRAADVVARRDGIPLEVARGQLYRGIQEQYPHLAGARLLDAGGAQARRILLTHPLLTTGGMVDGLARMMLVPGENALLELLGVDQTSGPAGDLVRLDLPSFVRKWVVERPAEFSLFAFALAHLALVYVLVAIALWRRPPEAPGSRDLVVVAVVLAAYLVALSSGPEAYPRFRVPIAPLLAILAGLGCQHLEPRRPAVRP
jgi:4-amino-4-deoxy-L-arabinose transferase-like glycosyltransferase